MLSSTSVGSAQAQINDGMPDIMSALESNAGFEEMSDQEMGNAYFNTMNCHHDTGHFPF